MARIGLAVAVVALLAGAAVIGLRRDGSDATGPAGREPATTQVAPIVMPTTVAPPTLADIQALVASITAQLGTVPSAPGTAPPTKEEIEARVREELKSRFGITF